MNTFSFTRTLASTNDIIISANVGGVRPNGFFFSIDDVLIHTPAGPPLAVQGPFTWEQLMAQGLVSTGGAHGTPTISVSHLGIEVAGRTNNYSGIGLNINGLRNLSNRPTTADIVIQGNFTGGGGWGPRFDIWRDGSGSDYFEGTVPATAVFATGTTHRLVANSGELVPSFRVTAIYVAGSNILALPDVVFDRIGVRDWLGAYRSPHWGLFFGTRGATLSASVNYVTVGNRGTGTYDHNNGMTFNLDALRNLAISNGLEPVITIHGITSGTRVDLQNVTQGNLNTETAGGLSGGVFYLVIPSYIANSRPSWAEGGSGWPMLGTNDGHRANYQVTAIFLGGVNLFELFPAGEVLFNFPDIDPENSGERGDLINDLRLQVGGALLSSLPTMTENTTVQHIRTAVDGVINAAVGYLTASIAQDPNWNAVIITYGTTPPLSVAAQNEVNNVISNAPFNVIPPPIIVPPQVGIAGRIDFWKIVVLFRNPYTVQLIQVSVAIPALPAPPGPTQPDTGPVREQLQRLHAPQVDVLFRLSAILNEEIQSLDDLPMLGVNGGAQVEVQHNRVSRLLVSERTTPGAGLVLLPRISNRYHLQPGDVVRVELRNPRAWRHNSEFALNMNIQGHAVRGVLQSAGNPPVFDAGTFVLEHRLTLEDFADMEGIAIVTGQWGGAPPFLTDYFVYDIIISRPREYTVATQWTMSEALREREVTPGRIGFDTVPFFRPYTTWDGHQRARSELVRNAQGGISVYTTPSDRNWETLWFLLTNEGNLAPMDTVIMRGRAGTLPAAGFAGIQANARIGAHRVLAQTDNLIELGEGAAWELEFQLSQTDMSEMHNMQWAHNQPGIAFNAARSGAAAGQPMSFYVDEIIIRRPMVSARRTPQMDPREFMPEGFDAVTVTRFDMHQDPYILALQDGEVTALAGTAFLAIDGDGVAVQVVERNGLNTLHVTGRTQTFHGINILHEPIGFAVGDTITVTGRTGASWPVADTRMEMLINWSPWTTINGPDNLAPNMNFTISHTLSAADMGHIHERGMIRIIGNGWGGVNVADMDFHIFSIEVTYTQGVDLGYEETVVRFNMQADEYLMGLRVGAVTDLGATEFLSLSGNPRIILNARNNRYLHVTGRTANWNGVDINAPAIPFSVGDTVRVVGRLGGNLPEVPWAAMILNFAPGGWYEATQSDNLAGIGPGGTFVLEHVLTAANVATITNANPPAIRIQTNNAPYMDFFIDNIEVIHYVAGAVSAPLIFAAPVAPPAAPVLLRFVMGHTTYTRNGIPFTFSAVPFIEGGRTHVPVEAMVDALGLSMDLNLDVTPARVVIYSEEITLVLRMGEALPGGLGMPIVRNGQVFVPMRFIAEYFGAAVGRTRIGDTQEFYLTRGNV